MRDARRFQPGSGVYTCGICGRKTRATGRGDNEYNESCAECYDLCGYENMIYDRPEDVTEGDRAEINRLYKAIAAKGGKPSFAHRGYIEGE
jgi:CRISPR/Cas system-associated protein Cas10 (large subunit of type III CRISPR-Cas system)